jgi:hypothetical protein
MQYKFLILLIGISFLLGSCGSVSSSKSSDSSQPIQIEENTQETNTVEETVRMNNCGGKADATQDAERALGVSLEGEAELGVDTDVLQASVKARYEQGRMTRKSLTLVAPPGTRMEFDVIWTEKTWIGTIIKPGVSGQAKYKAHLPIAVELIGSRDMGCGEIGEAVTPVLLSTQVPESSHTTIMPATSLPATVNLPINIEPTMTLRPTLSTVQKEFIGLWEYGQPRPPMPSPAGLNEVILANGDIDNSGTCHIKVFSSNEIVQGLGEGTFQLWRISGTTEQIESVIIQIQQGAAAHAGSPCPRL